MISVTSVRLSSWELMWPDKRLEIQSALVTNKSTLGRTWEQIAWTIYKFTANRMGCSRIYKTALSQFFKLDKTELVPKDHFGDLSVRATYIAGKKETSGLGKRVDACILALITEVYSVYVNCWQIEGMKDNHLSCRPMEEARFSSLYLQWGSVWNQDNWLSFFISVACCCHLSAPVFWISATGECQRDECGGDERGAAFTF